MNDHVSIDISVIIVIGERYDEIETVYREYKSAITAQTNSYEFIYVLDGQHPEALAKLKALKSTGENIRIFTFSSWFGEAAALRVGFEHAHADKLITLPAYIQVKSETLTQLLVELGPIVVSVTWAVESGLSLERLQTKLQSMGISIGSFHCLLRKKVFALKKLSCHNPNLICKNAYISLVFICVDFWIF